MTERQLQFRVGLFTLLSLGIGAGLVFQFGELRRLWEPTYAVEVLFDKAAGVYAGTPVLTNGIKIGEVADVRLAPDGVVVTLAVQERYVLKADAVVGLNRGLLGDASVDVDPGREAERLPRNRRTTGTPYSDPMEAVKRLERQVSTAVASFQETSDEWRRVGGNLNAMMDTNRGNFDLVVERAAESLHQFTVTMQTLGKTAEEAGSVVGDPQNRENLRKTLAALPAMVEDTRAAIAAMRSATQKADENLGNIAEATAPLADRSASIVAKLDGTLANLESLSREMNEFALLMNDEDGTLRKLASDPSLYRNLDRSAESLTVLLTNMEPVLRDLRVFSDKIARYPELMGVGGAMNGSDGTKGVDPIGYDTVGPRPLPPGSAARAGGATQRR